LILVMTVEPGKSGQAFIDDMLAKIRDINRLVSDKDVIIEVDGGVNLDNYKKIIDCGARFLVMGNAFYKSNDRKKFLSTIDSHYDT